MTSVILGWMKSRHPTYGTRATKDRSKKRPWQERLPYNNDVLDNEEQYRDVISEQVAQRHEGASHFCEKMSEAISYSEDAF